MKPRDIAIALACVVLWGLTFPLIKALSPFVPGVLLTALRFSTIAVAAVLLPMPKMPFGKFAAYSALFGCGQYLMSTMSIYLGLSAGVAAVLMQTQVFLTILAAAVLMREPVRAWQWAGTALGFVGLATFVAFNAYLSVSLAGLLAALAGSASWAIVNLIVKTSKTTNLSALVAWGALPNVPVMLLLSYSLGEFERFSPTPPQILALIGALIFLGLVVTFGASILWNRLLQQYTSVSVVPYSLLIPVVGMLSSWLFFDDIAGKQLLPIALIVLGLAVTLRPARQTPQAVAASAATAPR